MQRIYAQIGDDTACLRMPDPGQTLLDDICWGDASDLFSPAFWKAHVWQHMLCQRFENLKLGRTLTEEIAACLLGGFGMPAELGLAAFSRLQARELIGPNAREHDLIEALLEPLWIDGRQRHYRFARQKAHYLHATFAYLAELDEPEDDVALRDYLMGASGVGPKTASWVVRNYRASDQVAILDVHIMRACNMMGVFRTRAVTAANYLALENSYLRLADALEVRAGLLDAVIWDYMRTLNGARVTPAA